MPKRKYKMSRRHKMLWNVCKKLPSDYEPWGKRSDNERGGDCSCSCRFYMQLFDERHNTWDMDWGICVNPESPRAGLLTFEHQGCPHYKNETKAQEKLWDRLIGMEK